MLRSSFREVEWEAAYRARQPQREEQSSHFPTLVPPDDEDDDGQDAHTQRVLAFAAAQRMRNKTNSVSTGFGTVDEDGEGYEGQEVSASWSNARGVMVAFSNGDSTKFVRAEVNESGYITCKTPL